MARTKKGASKERRESGKHETKRSGKRSSGPLPYPDSDLSPALQRTIRHKLDAGEDEAVDREEFERAIRRVVQQRED